MFHKTPLPSWRLRDSNSRPPACKAGALPAELRPHDSGSRLLSHAVPRIVPSAARALTIVFGMGTGVSLKRIATRIFSAAFLPRPFSCLEDSSPWHLNSNAAPTSDSSLSASLFPRKEVIQPHLPIRLPCYDFTPVIRPAFGGSLLFWLGHRLRAFPAPMV